MALQNIAGQTEITDLTSFLAHISEAAGTHREHFGRFFTYTKCPGHSNKLEVVFQEMPCYGCNWKCIYKIKKGDPTPCISNIKVDEVWNKVKTLLLS